MMKSPFQADQQGAAHAIKAGRPLRDPGDWTADLHLHSTFSDGVKTPAELCSMARKAHVQFLSLTDHDTAAGLEEMARCAQAQGMQFIPGAEVSTGESGSVHVLGYGEKIRCDEMTAFLLAVASDRVRRAERMIDLLQNEGILFSQQTREQLLSNPSVGRPHIARALVEIGAASTVRQAFDRYLIRGRCGYVPRQLPSTGETVRTMRRCGVVPVLAHPLKTGLDWPALNALLLELKGCGLMGLEAFHPSVHASDAQLLDKLARSLGLLVTGGSDYHGDPGSTIHIGRLPSGWPNRREDLNALLEAIQG